MSHVIYARVPETLKEAADAYAAERGATLTSTVVDLLERGLAAVADEVSVGVLEARVAQLTSDKAGLEAQLRAVAMELGTLRALAEATRKTVGTCPNPQCRKPITGYDLLASGKCATCSRALPDLLTFASSTGPGKKGSPGTGNINERDVLLLLGAVGAVVGVAFLASRGGA